MITDARERDSKPPEEGLLMEVKWSGQISEEVGGANGRAAAAGYRPRAPVRQLS